jgi:hypothetical protein
MNSNNHSVNLGSLSHRPNEFEEFILNGEGIPGLISSDTQPKNVPPADYQTQLQEYYHNYYNSYYQKAMKNAIINNIGKGHHQRSSNPLGIPPPPPVHNSRHVRNYGEHYSHHNNTNNHNSDDLGSYFQAEQRVNSSLGYHNSTHNGNNQSQFISSAIGRQPKKSLIYNQPRYVTTEPLVIHQSADLTALAQPQQPQQIIIGQNGQLELVQQALPTTIETTNSAVFQLVNGSNNPETLITSNGGLATGRYKLLTRSQQVYVDSGTSGALPSLISVPQQQSQQALTLPTILTSQQVQPTTVRFASPLVEQSLSATARSVILPRIDSVKTVSSNSNGWVNLSSQQQQQPLVLTVPQGVTLSTGVTANGVTATTNDPLRQVVLSSLVNQPSAQQLVYKL